MKVSINFILSAALCLVFQQAVDAAQIRICAETNHGFEPISDADVKCWDDDFGSDDFMTSGKTSSDGCVTLNYNKKHTGWKCWKWWVLLSLYGCNSCSQLR